jgi:hypothetical protein
VPWNSADIEVRSICVYIWWICWNCRYDTTLWLIL